MEEGGLVLATEAVMVVAEKEGEEMVMVGMVAAAKVEAEMAAVEKVAAGMEEEMAEATEVKQEVALVGGKEAEMVLRQLVRHLRSSMR